MYLPDGSEIKGSPIVCWAHHVFQRSLNTYFHCTALKAAVIWQTERGKALSRVGVVCEEHRHPFTQGTAESAEATEQQKSH